MHNQIVKFILLISLISIKAQAAVYVEPFLGYLAYAKTKYELTKTEDDETYASWKNRNFDYGLRLGGKYNVVLYGLELVKASVDFEADESTSEAPFDISGSWSQTHFGIFLGIELPLSMRLRYAYYIDSHITSTQQASFEDKLTGDGYAFGFGYSFFAWLTLNLDYRRSSMDLYKQKTPAEETRTQSKYKYKEWVLSVSFPLGLGEN